MPTFEFKINDYTAENVVDNCMTEFTIDVAAQKVASMVDGLKSVHRRLLWVMNTNDKWINLNTFVGRVLEIHPVGDRSISEACIRAMQEHSMGIPLLKGKGNVGGYDSNDAGADRYLKVIISPIAKDLFFEGVNLKTLPMKETEDFMNVEPVYFIPRLPTALLIYSLTLGVGFKSEIFPLNLDDVCILVQKFLDNKSKNGGQSSYMDYSKYVQHFIPDFPIRNIIRNSDDLLKAYSRGNFNPQIVTDGYVDVYPNQIVLKTAPFGTQFEGVEERLRQLLKDKKSWLHDLCTGYGNFVDSDTEGSLAISLKRSTDTFGIAYRLVKELSLSRGVRTIPNYVTRKGKIVSMTPPKLIDIWYAIRKESMIGGIKADRIQTMKQTIEKKTKLLVSGHWDEVNTIVRQKEKSHTEIINNLMDRFDLSYYQAKLLAYSPIISASKVSSDELNKDLENLEKKALLLKDSQDKIDELIYRDTEYFRKKYHRPRCTKITPYLGYVCIDDKNIYQFDSFEEGQDLLERFVGSKIFFYQDQKKMPHQIVLSDSNIIPAKMRLPRFFPGNDILEAPDGQLYMLCLINNTASVVDCFKNSTLISTKGFCSESEHAPLFIPISKSFIGICADGTVIQTHIRDYTSRKGLGKQGARTDLIYAIPSCLTDIVLVHMSSVDPLNVYFSKIHPTTTKIPMTLMGDTFILGVSSTKVKNSVMFNLPSWASSGMKYITVQDMGKFMNGTDAKVVNISRKAVRDPKIRTSVLV